jgi:hypothetical protein
MIKLHEIVTLAYTVFAIGFTLANCRAGVYDELTLALICSAVGAMFATLCSFVSRSINRA